jgi:hypothetical protein
MIYNYIKEFVPLTMVILDLWLKKCAVSGLDCLVDPFVLNKHLFCVEHRMGVGRG